MQRYAYTGSGIVMYILYVYARTWADGNRFKGTEIWTLSVGKSYWFSASSGGCSCELCVAPILDERSMYRHVDVGGTVNCETMILI